MKKRDEEWQGKEEKKNRRIFIKKKRKEREREREIVLLDARRASVIKVSYICTVK